MTSLLKTSLTVLLIIFAVAGWAVAANLAVRSIAVRQDDAGLTMIAHDYAVGQVEAQAGRKTYQLLEVQATGQALATIKAIEVANPSPVNDLVLVGEPVANMIWRAGGAALVEVNYEVSTQASGSTHIGEHYLLKLIGNDWKVEATWRIIPPEPGAPLIPSPSVQPGPSTSAGPGGTPAPSETTPPFETPPPLQSDQPA